LLALLLLLLLLLQGNGKLIFQGVISYIACILITYLGFAMMRFANIEQKYMRKLDGAAQKALQEAAADASAAVHTRRHAWSVFLLAASAVLREGIESIVFLAGGYA
jgi:FTR1 family protein